MEEKIIENWKAIEDLEQKIREQTGDPEAGFNSGVFWLNGNGRHLMIPISYRGKKGKKGQETFTRSRKEIMIYAKFCPFTGKPLYKESSNIKADSVKQKNINRTINHSPCQK